MRTFLNQAFYFLFVISAFVSCSSDTKSNQESVPLEAEIQMNVSYGSDPQQVFDIYLPANRSSNKTKTLILIHGGGWVEGDKADMAFYIASLQQSHPDHAIVNMNYVLATIGTPAFPNQFLDLQMVLNKLTLEQEEYQIRPEFGLIGASAGAHIALQYDSVYDTDDQVKMVVDIVGPTDFTDSFYATDPDFMTALSFLMDESAYPNTNNYAAEVSPALQVNGNTSPTILFYGNNDPLVPISNGKTLQTKLTQHDVTNSFTAYDAGHGDFSEVDALDLQVKISAFINQHLAIEN